MEEKRYSDINEKDEFRTKKSKTQEKAITKISLMDIK